MRQKAIENREKRYKCQSAKASGTKMPAWLTFYMLWTHISGDSNCTSNTLPDLIERTCLLEPRRKVFQET